MRYFSSQALVVLVASLIVSSVVMAQEEEEWIREITSAAVLNIGTENATEYYFPLDQVYEKRLAYITAENRKTKEALEVTKDEFLYDPEFQFYKIQLSTPLAPGEKVQITVKATFTGLARPYPLQAAQDERQQFLYFGNPFALTAYPAVKQKTTVITPNSKLEVLASPEESKLVISNNQITLGPYNDVDGFEHGMFEVQYELPMTVPHVNSLRRDIEVSHWGNNLAVEEHYNFVNKGAELKGFFSRVDFQRNPMGIHNGNGIMSLQTTIPKLAREIYYRDEIGNISTSALAHQPDHVIFTMVPRFPILGGWKTTWYMGYNVLLDGYLRRTPNTDKYILKVPVFVPMKETSYDDIEIRVVLPEGAKNAYIHIPYDVDSVEHSTTKTYMDSAGRYTITIKARNLIEEHEQDMLIEYEFSDTAYLTKPLAAAIMLMIIFTTSMVFSRLNFKIGGSILKK
ncbi:proteasome regulatory particle base subunit [Modicella reniformis]|uniref:Dolichyl-diphosphooligosaccharide--protein glycosyltransferase subunit 1 n=1 Tax=Modicella reniformis TaxID=1440133 RepID=A0A9P6SNJ0_9FUNG|nr:proteasome regulatory particle base subunit [Modicella reniformis]